MSGTGQREVLMNSTESVGQLDLNNMQRFLRAFSDDWMFGQSGSFQGAGDAGAAGMDRSVAVFCVGDSAAPFPSATAMRIDTLGGPLAQWVGYSGDASPLTFPFATSNPPSSWGQNPYMMVYWTSPNELQTTHDAADSSNPRWDLVCIKLNDVSDDIADQESRLQKQLVSGSFVISAQTFIKRRKVTLSKTVVKGTPAGSPAIPAVPSGFKPYYAIRIPAAFSSAFPVDNNFHDYRMPLGSHCVDVWASDVLGSNPAGLTLSGGPNASASTTSAYPVVTTTTSNSLVDFLPRFIVSPSTCRLIGLSLLSVPSISVWSADVGSYLAASNGTFANFGGNATWANLNMNNPAASSWDFKGARLASQAGNSSPSAASKPPWGTGYPSGYAARAERTVTTDTHAMLGARLITSGSGGKLAYLRFHFAGGAY